MLDGPHEIADYDQIADDEGLVEDDREGREEVAEDVLERERDCDPSDPEGRDERGDVDDARAARPPFAQSSGRSPGGAILTMPGLKRASPSTRSAWAAITSSMSL